MKNNNEISIKAIIAVIIMLVIAEAIAIFVSEEVGAMITIYTLALTATLYFAEKNPIY